ncbi:uncharacterized protein [Dendrobates tinctorius]
MWVHPLLRRRLTKGHFHRLYASLRSHPDKFYQYCLMSMPTFDILLKTVCPGITYKDTVMRKSTSAEEDLLLTLRFLSTALSYAALHFEFLIGKSTISGIVRSTCSEIWSRLHQSVIPEPKKQDWLRIARGFEETCQFPNCIGSLHGKHIHITSILITLAISAIICAKAIPLRQQPSESEDCDKVTGACYLATTRIQDPPHYGLCYCFCYPFWCRWDSCHVSGV